MGGARKSGKGGGGGGKKGRNCNPNQRVVLSKEVSVPGRDLRAAGNKLNAKRDRILGGKANRIGAAFVKKQEAGTARDRSDMAAMALSAAQRQAYHGMVQSSSAGPDGQGLGVGGAAQDHTLRRFFKDFKKVVDQADVLLEVVDARDPIGCRLHHFEKAIASQFGDAKQVVLVLNKVDLLPLQPPDALNKSGWRPPTTGSCGNAVADAWVEHFAQEGHTCVPFTTKKGRGLDNAVQNMFKQLRSLSKTESGVHKALTVGVIGYPNVGKSSLINALKGRSVVGVGNTPGFTTANTEVMIRGDVRIIDCPGVVMPGDDTGDVVLRNATKLTGVEDPLAAVARLLARTDPFLLAYHYGIPAPTALRALPLVAERVVMEFVRDVAIKRGRVLQGGLVDDEAAARLVLQDWNDGRVGYYSLPPMGSGIMRSGAEQGFSAESQAAVEVLRTLSKVGSDLPTFHLMAACGAETAEDVEGVEWAADARPVKKVKARGVKFNPMDTTDEDTDPEDDDEEDGMVQYS